MAYTLYTVDPKGNFVRIKDGGVGSLRKEMNSLRSANKSTTYAIYSGQKLVTRVG
jgi:hypothetical protein